MRIVITGASGFIGRHLCGFLRRLPAIEVLAVSRSDRDECICVPSYDLSPQGDVLIYLSENPDRVAVNSEHKGYQREAIRNLKSLVNRPYSRVIYLSSAAIYGDDNADRSKTTDRVEAVDTYSEIKLISESIVLEKKNNIVIRPSNIYGVGMSSQNVMSRIFSQLNNRKPTVFLNQITPIRDFLLVDDLVSAIVKFIFSSGEGIFNVGTGFGTSILDLSRLILDLAGVDKNIIETGLISKKQSYLVLDIDKTVAHIDWMPIYSLRKGLSKTLAVHPW
jgi:nucleoside-diphosphate-sugar epimerase